MRRAQSGRYHAAAGILSAAGGGFGDSRSGVRGRSDRRRPSGTRMENRRPRDGAAARRRVRRTGDGALRLSDACARCPKRCGGGPAMPEVFLTAFLNLFMLGEIRPAQAALIHGGGSGVGTASIQLLREAGARSIVTAGSDEKCEQCLKLGADIAINYNAGPFVEAVKAATNGRGADVILDSIGGAYL